MVDALAADVIVQRFDSDGYRIFPDEGIHALTDTPYPTGWLIGAVLGEDGSLMLAFGNRTISGDYRIYGQKMSPTGELLWGATGKLASDYSSTDQYEIIIYPLWVVSDGSGGFWTLWRIPYTTDIWICGINGDGTVKYPGGRDIFLGEYQGYYWMPKLFSDGEGGVYVFWGEDMGESRVRRIFGQHVLANGERAYPEPRVVMEIVDSYFSPSLHVVPDLTGGFYLCTSRAWQRVDSALSPLWALEGVVPNYPPNSDLFSRPAVLSDNSVARIGKLNGETYLVLMDSSGNHLLPDGWVSFGTNYGFYHISSYGLLTDPDGEYLYNMQLIAPELHKSNVRIQLVDPNGQDVWPQGSVLLWPFDNVEQPNQGQPVLNSNGELLFGVENTYQHKILFYKIYSDGTIAGRENDVAGRLPLEAIPSRFKLLSAYPNPFNAVVTMRVEVGRTGRYKMAIFNMDGRLVDSREHTFAPGEQILTWRPPNSISSGIYFVQWLHHGRPMIFHKVVYLK